MSLLILKKMGGGGGMRWMERIFMGIEMDWNGWSFFVVDFFFFSKEYIIKGTLHWEEIVRIVTM